MTVKAIALAAAAILLLHVPWAGAQTGVSTAIVTATLPGGAVAVGAGVELTAADHPGTTHTGVLDGVTPARVATLAAGTYRVHVELEGFHPADATLDVRPGANLRVIARLAPLSDAAGTRVVVESGPGMAHRILFDARALELLPGSRTVWSLLDIAHPFLIVERIDNGGLWSAAPALVAGYGSASSQTTIRLDGLDVTDPQVPGTPLFYPDLNVLQSVTVDSLLRPADSAGPGPVISLVPRRAGDRWTGSADAYITPRGLQSSGGAGDAPPIMRFDSWTDGSVTIGGPVSPRFGLLGSGRVTRARRLERDDPLVLANDVSTVYAHVFGAPATGHDLRLVTGGYVSTQPYTGRARFDDRDLDERGRAVVLSTGWDHVRGGGLWSLGGGYQSSVTDPSVSTGAAGGMVERLMDGPPLALTSSAYASRHRWDLHTAYSPRVRRWLGRDQTVRVGAHLGGASALSRAAAEPVFAELVNGLPARVWDVRFAGPESRRATVSASGFVQTQTSLAEHVTLNAGLRFDHDRGSARGATSTIRWTNLSPRLSAVWRPAGDDRLSLTAGYARYHHLLSLGYLSAGDPAGPTGLVYRWDDRNGDAAHSASELTAVAAVGACCAAGQFTTIDPDLRRPSTSEFLLGLEHAVGSWRWRVTGIDRRERNQLGLVNAGLTEADYTVTFLSDPGVDIAGASGVSDLPVYDRVPASFGLDRYVLTNPTDSDGRYQSGEITVDKALSASWQLRFGGLVHWSRSIGVNSGFRANENDHGLLGETFSSPNAGTNARGRPFFDRAYIIKMSGTYLAPGDVRVAVAARYQDGQPFARVVVAEGLNQGAEIIQAYRRGGQRFTYTMTVDARVEKRVTFGRRSVGVVVEAFNLLNRALEVEEDIVTGPLFRTVTAVQPPRAIRFGLRAAF